MGSLLLCLPLWENSSLLPEVSPGAIMVLGPVSQAGGTSSVLRLKVSLDPLAVG